MPELSEKNFAMVF